MAVTDPFLVRAVDYMRKFANDTLDEVRWTAGSMAELVDGANALVHAQMLTAREPKTLFRFAESTIAVTAGTEDYAYPGNFRKFIRMVVKDSAGNIYKEIFPADYLADTPGLILFDKLRGFRITPKPTVTENWTLVYEPGPAPILAYGRIDSGYTDTTTSTKLKVPDSSYTTNHSTGELGALGLKANFYDNCFLWVLDKSDNSIGVSRITNWGGSTRIATLSPALPFTPADDDLYQIMPCLDYPWDKAIAIRAAMMMKAADADLRHRSALEAEYRALLSEILTEQTDLSGRFGPTQELSFMEDYDWGMNDELPRLQMGVR